MRPPPGTVLTPIERERIDATIRETCSASLMSDTKWRKLFAALAAIPSIKTYYLKSLRKPDEVRGFGSFGLQTPHEFVDTPSYGPIYLREIEWIEFPRVERRAAGSDDLHQDIDSLQHALAAAGDFPIEETARGLRIVGHIRAT
jgi:hypothetical protein